ncbi:MAG: hypothetical protein ACLPUO_23640 [Streptosporangiaceae bacterium]
MKSAIFYYGLELPPDQAKTVLLKDATVVLQPYHPLLTEDKFARYFPHCSLFIYWNPTGVPPEALRAAAEPIPLLELDPVWNLIRLDLRSAAARRFAIMQGLAAWQACGTSVTGLFVDDLDLWSAGKRPAAVMALLSELQSGAAADAGIPLFVNRGFSFWPKLADLQAVLLEELTPGIVSALPPADIQWVERRVLPAVRRVRQRGVAVFGLTYEPEHASAPLTAAAARLAALTDNTIMTCRSVDQWPEDLQ